MAIQCNLPVQGGMIAVGAYVRIGSVTGGKNRLTGTFQASGIVQAFVSAAEANDQDGVPLVTSVCATVSKSPVDITANVLTQLYNQLELDLAVAGATNIVEV
mgnify:CR=1 FL=1